MTDDTTKKFYLGDAVSILRDNGTSDHADAVAWAAKRIVALEAQLTARSKLLQRGRDQLIWIKDELDDEGDRVFFGSTNHADAFRELVDEMDSWTWSDIIEDATKHDYIGEVATLRADAAKLIEALEPFVRAAVALETHDPAFPDDAAVLRAGLSFFVMSEAADPDDPDTQAVTNRMIARAVTAKDLRRLLAVARALGAEVACRLSLRFAPFFGVRGPQLLGLRST